MMAKTPFPTQDPPTTGETPKEAPKFPDGEIDQFLARRVCSRCYGDLQKVPAEDRLWAATCPTCGDAWCYTTVSRSYAERLGQEALEQAGEVKRNLPDLFPSPHKGKTPEQLIAELGYT